jgi:hypothetical protein
MHLANTRCLKSKMIQIRFGLIWVNPKDQNIKKTNKTQRNPKYLPFLYFYFVIWAVTIKKAHEWWINLYIQYQETLCKLCKVSGIQGSRFWEKLFESQSRIQESRFWETLLISNPRFKVQDSEKNLYILVYYIYI